MRRGPHNALSLIDVVHRKEQVMRIGRPKILIWLFCLLFAGYLGAVAYHSKKQSNFRASDDRSPVKDPLKSTGYFSDPASRYSRSHLPASV
jgi:hypothetical protein